MGSYILHFFLLLLQIHVLYSRVVVCQLLINGQVFTNGLAIVDAPNPNRCVYLLFSVDSSSPYSSPVVNSQQDKVYLLLLMYSLSTLTITDCF